MNEQETLFSSANRGLEPLANRMRPVDFDQVCGQKKLIGPRGVLREIMKSGKLPSMIFWGPPGTGKTTLGRIIAHQSGAQFLSLSAVLDGVKDLREAISQARKHRQMGHATILFVDEIHRWNKAQQDALLPHIENGTIVLMGATTENPSFELNPALLSRCQVMVVESLGEEEVKEVLLQALRDDVRGLKNPSWTLSEEAISAITHFSGGDARKALNILEALSFSLPKDFSEKIDGDRIEKLARRKIPSYRKKGEEHYDLASALIKSLRASDADAGLYYLSRMLEAGEDPQFLARRLIIFASEDVGNADPRGIEVAIAVAEAVRWVGLPEAAINLAQGVTYLASAPKSNASYMGLRKAQQEVRDSGDLEVPMKIRNAPTGLMKNLGYGKGYDYSHREEGSVYDNCLPEEISSKKFYEPKPTGFEKKIQEYQDFRKNR